MKKFITYLSVLLVISVGWSTSLHAQDQEWLWQNPFPQGNILRGTATPDSNTIIMVGDAGTIIKTKDKGLTWDAQDSGTDQDLYSVSFLGPDNAFAVGTDGTILRNL